MAAEIAETASFYSLLLAGISQILTVAFESALTYDDLRCQTCGERYMRTLRRRSMRVCTFKVRHLRIAPFTTITTILPHTRAPPDRNANSRCALGGGWRLDAIFFRNSDLQKSSSELMSLPEALWTVGKLRLST